MAARDVIVIGASAGGLDPIARIVAGLPGDLPASLFIVVHRPAMQASALDGILRRDSKLEVEFAAEGERIRTGRIHLAPPDRHLVVQDDRVRLTNGPKENHFRPAVDPLFRSAAYAYGPRVIGIVLSGALDDGTSGLWWIKDRGGTAIVQDPTTATHTSMPESAIENVAVDHRLPPDAIPEALAVLTRRPVKGTSRSAPVPVKELETEVRIARGDDSLVAGVKQLGEPSEFTCPECHGVLLEVHAGKPLRYRCHTGHAYSKDSLLNSLSESVEQSAWNAIRDIEERERYLGQLAERARAAGDETAAARYVSEASADRRRADAIRAAVTAT